MHRVAFSIASVIIIIIVVIAPGATALDRRKHGVAAEAARLDNAHGLGNLRALDFDLLLKRQHGCRAVAFGATPLTACWAKGRNIHYAYYHCPKRGCESYGKSVKRDVIESQFATYLQTLPPSPILFDRACRIFEDFWNEQAAASAVLARSLKAHVKKLETQIDGLLEKIVAAESPLVVGAFEKTHQQLSEEKLAQEERLAKSGRPVRDFDETLRTALGFLQNRCKLWVSEAFEDKRAVLKLVFGQPLRQHREKGFLEPELALPFRALSQFLPQGAKWRRGSPPQPGFSLSHRNSSHPCFSGNFSIPPVPSRLSLSQPMTDAMLGTTWGQEFSHAQKGARSVGDRSEATDRKARLPCRRRCRRTASGRQL